MKRVKVLLAIFMVSTVAIVAVDEDSHEQNHEQNLNLLGVCPDLHVSILNVLDLNAKVNFLEMIHEVLLEVCKEIRLQHGNLPYSIRVLSNISRTLESSVHPMDISSDNKKKITFDYYIVRNIIEYFRSFTYGYVWEKDTVEYSNFLQICDIYNKIKNVLEELEYLLHNLIDLTIESNKNGLDLSIPINLSTSENEEDARKFYKSLSVLTEKSNMPLIRDLRLTNHAISSDCWQKLICSLPVSVKKINFYGSNINTPIDLSHLKNLEQLGLGGIPLSSASDWEQLLSNLPTSLRVLYLDHIEIGFDIDYSDAEIISPLDLSHLENLEEIGLYESELHGLGFGRDWEEVCRDSAWCKLICSLAPSVKRLFLMESNLDSLIILDHLNSLEYIDLDSITLDDPSDWKTLLSSLSPSVKRLALSGTNINSSLDLRHLNLLEEVLLHGVELSNPSDWGTLLSSLSPSVKRLELSETNIDSSLDFRHLNQLEEVLLHGVELSNPSDWYLLISFLPRNITKIELDYSNCPDDLRELLKSRGIDAGYSDNIL